MTLEIGAIIYNSFASLLGLELALTIWLNSLPQYFLTAAKLISNSVYLMLFLLVYFSWKNHSPRRGVYFAFTILSSYLLATFLKLAFDVPRPLTPNPVEAYAPSFPSRHSQLAFTGVVLATDSSIKKVIATKYFAMWAVLISLSRLVLGVHYPHDILAGAIFGYLLGHVLLKAKRQMKQRLFDLTKYPRKFVMKPEYKLEFERKLFHIIGGLFMALLALFLPEFTHVPILLGALVLTIFLSYAAKKKLKMKWLEKILARMERTENLETFPLRGTAMVFAGGLISAILFDPTITAASIIVVALGDGFSTMFGILFGVSPIFYNTVKDWEGIFIGIIAAFFGLVFLYPPAIAAYAATIPMLVESLDLRVGKNRIDDNLLIPPIAGAVIWLLL